jgi:hypothetical protein
MQERSRRAREARQTAPQRRKAKLAKRYPDPRQAIPAAAEALFLLNRYAKPASCTRDHHDEIGLAPRRSIMSIVRANTAFGTAHSNPPSGTDLLRPLLEVLPSIARDIRRIADRLDPPPAAVVGSRYVADRLGQTTTWVAEMARAGTIPAGCLVPGSGNGKPWKFYRERIEAWIATR